MNNKDYELFLNELFKETFNNETDSKMKYNKALEQLDNFYRDYNKIINADIDCYKTYNKIINTNINCYNRLLSLMFIINKLNLDNIFNNTNVEVIEQLKEAFIEIYQFNICDINNFYDNIFRKINNAISINREFENHLKKLSKEELIKIIMKNK